MSYNALIVDNDRRWAMLFATLLRAHGGMSDHEINTDTSEAWRTLTANLERFDILFLDIADVETNECSTEDLLVRTKEATYQMPVVMITGSDEIREAARHWGADHYWQKEWI